MSETVRLDHGTIAYRDLGAGEPIVFVHGLLVDGRLWAGVAEGLASGFRVWCPTGRWARTERRWTRTPTSPRREWQR